MTPPIVEVAAGLSEAGEPFVLATVVWRRGPSSGRQGAKAVVRPNGRVEGWLGGACAQPTVVKEALAALRDGRPRLLFLGPAEDWEGSGRPGVVRVPMACESEGAMEVFLEPVLPAPQVVAVGGSPAARMLVELATTLGWRAGLVADPGELSAAEHTFVVVATQGHYDEEALTAALATPAAYVGLVASRKRADQLLGYLRERGVAEEALTRVHAPAGLDLGPVEPEEIAVAILADLVARRSSADGPAAVEVVEVAEATDPVCGMVVAVAGARHTQEHQGTTYYFCSEGCRRRFSPQRTE